MSQFRRLKGVVANPHEHGANAQHENKKESLALYAIIFLNFLTFYLIFPAEYFSVYVFIRKHRALHNVLYSWGVWLFLSTLVIPCLLWMRAVLDLRTAQIAHSRRVLLIDCAVMVSWIVVFWGYILFRTPFLVMIAAHISMLGVW
jgi:hypothetical protein